MISRISVFLVFVCVSSLGLRASLEDILAPLPAIVVMKSMDRAEEQDVRPESAIFNNSEVARDLESMQGVDVVRENESLAIREADIVFFPITRDDLLLAIEEEVNARLRPVARLSLAPMRPLPDLSKHSQPFTIRLGGVPGRLARYTMNLNIQVENGEGILGNWTIPFSPHVFSDAWFAKGHLRKGDLGSPSDFETRQVDLLLETDAVDTNSETLRRHEYSRDIRPGSPLLWRDLTERSLVRRGQVVDVTAYQGMIVINMRARVQEDGVQGDMISLQNLESNKSFTGQVIGEGRVQVTF